MENVPCYLQGSMSVVTLRCPLSKQASPLEGTALLLAVSPLWVLPGPLPDDKLSLVSHPSHAHCHPHSVWGRSRSAPRAGHMFCFPCHRKFPASSLRDLKASTQSLAGGFRLLTTEVQRNYELSSDKRSQNIDIAHGCKRVKSLHFYFFQGLHEKERENNAISKNYPTLYSYIFYIFREKI